MGSWSRVGRPTTIPDGVDGLPHNHVITVRNRRISIDDANLVQNNVRTDTITLDLDSDWDGLGITVNLGECPSPFPLIWEGSPLTIPAAACAEVGGVDVSIVGVSSDGKTQVVTVESNNAFKVAKSGCVTSGDLPEDPTSLLGQVLAAAENANKAAESADTAATSANSAATAATTAAQSANAAATSATTAASSATSAASSANSAANAANAAAQTANAAAEAAGAAAEAARGNVLKGTLGPSPLLSADDAYATKPRKLTVYGETRQNLWATPSGTNNGVTVTSNTDGSVAISGSLETTTTGSYNATTQYILRPGSTYTLSVDRAIGGVGTYLYIAFLAANGAIMPGEVQLGYSSAQSQVTFTVPTSAASVRMGIGVKPNTSCQTGTYRVMLNEGSEAEPWCPPGINGVDELAIVVSTTDSAEDGTTTPIDLQGHTLNALPDGTRDELRIDGTGAVTLVQRVGVATAPTEASGWGWYSETLAAYFSIKDVTTDVVTADNGMCDKLPMRPSSASTTSYPVYASAGGAYRRGYAKHPSITGTGTAAIIAGGATYLYPLATPETIPLSPVTLPTLPAPTVNVWADASASGTGYAMGPDAEMEYERDVTKAIGGLEARVAALEEAQ